MLTEKIYAHARRAPDRTAVVYNNNKMPYGRLARLIETSRRHFLPRVRPDAGVAVLTVGSLLDAWIQGLALRSLGLTTVITESPEHIHTLGLPAIACVVATEAEYRADVEAACTATGWPFIRVPRAVYAAAAAAPAPSAGDLAAAPGGHILLTSGTTGVYKKVLVSPATEAAKTALYRDVFEISDRSVVNTFDFAGWTGVGYLIDAYTLDAGGCVVLCQGPNPFEAFRYPGITHALATPHLLARVLAAPPGALRRDDSLRLYVTAGPLSRSMAEDAKARLTRRVYTSIGATEASTFAITPIDTADDLVWHRVISSRVAQAVDEGDRPLPLGQIGRLRVDTFGGVTGYLHEEHASREFFRDGFFHTGDLAVFRSDGRFALQGRVTDIVNVFGDKVAAGPIEAALQEKFALTGVCVVSMPDEDGQEIVHVAIESATRFDPSALAAALAEAFRGTVPARIHYVDALPRNGMGKIERATLRDRIAATSTRRSSHEGTS